MAHVEKRGPGPDGRERSQTFDRKVDAERWLAQVETDKARGQWVDPAAGRITFEAWFAEWMATTTDLRPNTRALYEYLGRRYLLPGFGSKELAKVTAIDIRRWLAGMRGTKLSKNTVAKAYRLLAHVMTTAADEGLIGRSPCVIKGAGTEHLPEMQFATVDQVAELADAVGPRYRALVLLAAFGGLRWGELGGLRHRRVDLLHRTVTVAEILTEVNGRLDRRKRRRAGGTWFCRPSWSTSSPPTSSSGGRPDRKAWCSRRPRVGRCDGRTSVGVPGSRPHAR